MSFLNRTASTLRAKFWSACGYCQASGGRPDARVGNRQVGETKVAPAHVGSLDSGIMETQEPRRKEGTEQYDKGDLAMEEHDGVRTARSYE